MGNLVKKQIISFFYIQTFKIEQPQSPTPTHKHFILQPHQY